MNHSRNRSVTFCVRFWALALLCATAFCQVGTAVSSQSLDLQTIGHGFWKPRRPFIFKVFSTPEGSKARIDYVTLRTRNEAKQYLRTCLRPGTKIIYRQEKKEPNGQVVGERIVAVLQESGKKEFALIRGVHLNYYFISSSSLEAVIEVEEEAVEE